MNQRNNKQRNYYRNGDIVYNENRTKLGGASINYDTVSNPSFSLNRFDGNLYYNEQTITEGEVLNKGVLTIKIDPYIYLKIEVDSEMYLIGEVPNIIYNSNLFELDETNGNFIINIEDGTN